MVQAGTTPCWWGPSLMSAANPGVALESWFEGARKRQYGVGGRKPPAANGLPPFESLIIGC